MCKAFSLTHRRCKQFPLMQGFILNYLIAAMKYKRNSLLLMLPVLLIACNNNKKPDDKAAARLPVDTVNEISNTAITDTLARAGSLNSYVPAGFQIDLQAEGDLNKDKQPDAVLVLLNKKDTAGLRTTLVLFGQNGSYKLFKKSVTAVGKKFAETGYPVYSVEDVSIDTAGTLKFEMNDPGPAGTLESDYQLINKELLLTHIGTFNMGAGGQTELNLDLLKGIYTQEDINTMKENEPTVKFTRKYPIKPVPFENAKPDEIIRAAFKRNGK